MEWYVWVALGIFAVPAWFVIGALAERASRSIFDPGIILTGEPTKDPETLTWLGPFGLLMYFFVCVIAVLVVTVKLCYRFVQWIRGVKKS